MSDARAPWDDFQREILDALGHVVYAMHDASAQPRSANAADADAPPLLQALSRAANVGVAQLPALPPPEQLRTPSAKRALWPRLRTLRKAARG